MVSLGYSRCSCCWIGIAVDATAGGAAPAALAVVAALNGVASASAATTVASFAFVGASTAIDGSAAYALANSSNADEFAGYGEEALISTAVGGTIGAGLGYATYSISKANEPFVPDEYWSRNAPKNSTPGAKFDHYKNNNGVIEKSTVIYDNYGRQQYRIDYNNHGYSDHSKPHLHEFIYGPGHEKGWEFRWDFWR